MLSGLEQIPHKLRSELQSVLRVCDEAIALPGASRSAESGAFKNVVFRLSGADSELNGEIFSPNWFAGVSAVVVPSEMAEVLVRDPAKRQAALRKLVAKIPSETADSDVQVGPELDGDETDRDKTGWVAGFDSSSCCVGLYSARQSRSPETGIDGMNRMHSAYYLVCKSGGGVAAQTLHSRLIAALQEGKTLDECFQENGSPGAQALRRVSMASERNRARILAMAAEAMGFAHGLDTISDNAASHSAPHRGCIPTVSVTYNSLRKVDGVPRSVWQYSSGCTDALLSQGLMSSSNLAEGFMAFTSSNDEFRVNLRNDAHNTLPFVTTRLQTTRDLVVKIADKHKLQIGAAHPDHEFVKERFAWKAKVISGDSNGHAGRIEPPALWGSHASEAFLANWARELGVATCKVIRMAPEIVCIAGMEPAKLRAAVKRVQEGVGSVSIR